MSIWNLLFGSEENDNESNNRLYELSRVNNNLYKIIY